MKWLLPWVYFNNYISYIYLKTWRHKFTSIKACFFSLFANFFSFLAYTSFCTWMARQYTHTTRIYAVSHVRMLLSAWLGRVILVGIRKSCGSGPHSYMKFMGRFSHTDTILILQGIVLLLSSLFCVSHVQLWHYIFSCMIPVVVHDILVK